MARARGSGTRGLRRNIHRLNVARAIAAVTLLVCAFIIELTLAPDSRIGPLYVLSAAAFAAILVHLALARFVGDPRIGGVVQVAGDAALVLGFVMATGGSVSPVSFLFALPVMIGAGLFGLRGGVLAATGAWLLYAFLLVSEAWRLPFDQNHAGRILYAAISHLVGFLSLGVFGGVLGDRLSRADRELEEKRGDLANLKAMHWHIVESISTGLMTTDPEGRVTFVNRAGDEILGAGEKIGRSATALFGLPAEVLSQAADHLRHGSRYRFERQWTRGQDGETLMLGFNVSALQETSGRPIGWLIVFQNLTEIASLEEQVRTRERMAALGEMAAGMAHELRNPLAAISGCVQVLRGGGQDVEPRSGSGAALEEVVVRESERLNRIIRDFLEFARPAPFRPRPCDLAPLMQEMARLLRASPEMRPDHEVEVIPGPGRAAALADPDRMRQVFWNLASNALRAMPDGGVLTIGISGYGGDRVMVEFRDEGHGMDLETARRLFQPFHGKFRQGTGLGAAIVYRIIEEHRGAVQLVSREGRGTAIRVILPAAAAAATETNRGTGASAVAAS